MHDTTVVWVPNNEVRRRYFPSQSGTRLILRGHGESVFFRLNDCFLVVVVFHFFRRTKPFRRERKKKNLLDKRSPYPYLRPGEPKKNNSFLCYYLQDHRMRYFLGEKLRSVSLRIQLSPGRPFRSLVVRPVKSQGIEWTSN